VERTPLTLQTPGRDSAGVRVRRPDKLAEIVARKIMHDITARNLPFGTPLASEKEMALQYEVARNTLREALRILEIHGLIQIRTGPGGGPSVGSVRSEDMGRMMTLFFHGAGATLADLIDVRVLLEPMAARAAAERPDRDALAELKVAVDRGQANIGSGSDWLPVATEFHDLVAELSGNRVLGLIARSLKDIYYSRLPGVRADSPQRWRQKVQRAHLDIAAAIVAGDADQADALMRVHIQDFAARVRREDPKLIDSTVEWL
jgi:GntR family transcriptional regulator, transcriptional repressor for pyruvate dehydrogenase complex